MIFEIANCELAHPTIEKNECAELFKEYYAVHHQKMMNRRHVLSAENSEARATRIDTTILFKMTIRDTLGPSFVMFTSMSFERASLDPASGWMAIRQLYNEAWDNV